VKKCNKCGKVLPLSHFSKGQSECKICSRDRQWDIKFGLSPEDYLEMYNKQDGKCACCGRYAEEVSNKNLAVDHDKDTGKIRGLLCSSCNQGIGLLGDDLESVIKAVRYLECI
jgi:hypothetical protein